jgi:AraC-like DNA-binding protein
MAPSLEGTRGAGLEPSCGPDEWVDASEPSGGVELFQARLRGHPFSVHRHDVYAIGVTEEGVQGFGYRGTVEHSLPGQVFVLHPDEPHDGFADGPDALGYSQIYVSPGRIAAAQRAITGRQAPLPFASPVADDPVLARVVRAAFAQPLEPLALDALVLQLAAGLLRCSTAGRNGVGRSSVGRSSVGRSGVGRSSAGYPAGRRNTVNLPAVERGRELLASRLTIVESSEVEAVTGLDRYQFARQFRAVYGTSPYRYSVLRRIDTARRWLGSGRPLAETAVEVGFADQAHFTRAFKAAFGMTPGRYAKLITKEGHASGAR